MFSDRLRGLKLALPAALLMALCGHYAHLAVTMPIGWRACLDDPAAADGRTLRFPLYTVSAVVGPDRYEISKTLRDIPVAGPTAGLSAGETVSVLATFRAADGVAVEGHRESHRLRGAKKALGIVGLLWALWMLPRTVSISGRRVVERG